MPRIEDYALIGDMHTAALVSREGSIDWLCLPRFDAPACFAALLGTPEHGRWTIAPEVPVRSVARRYRGDSLVLETEYVTDGGCVRVVEGMPLRDGNPALVRVVEGVRGEVPMRTELVVRFDYGSVVPWVRRRGTAWSAIAGADALIVRTDVPLQGIDLTTLGTFTVRGRQRIPFVAQWHPSHEPPPEAIDGRAALRETERWWQRWADRCRYEGPWKGEVRRSAVVLKALIDARTGGMVAAPTTSLPECLGGVRNWDYRYCWLRDATFAFYALMSCGYLDEAAAWREWLLRAVAGDPSKLQVLYSVAGERRIHESEVPWLPGFAGSRPVRVGNAAFLQRQQDVYGEIMDTSHLARRSGVGASTDSWNLERNLVEYLESAWAEPGEGIWEVRGPARHFTHSKVMSWVALDRAVKAIEQFGLEGPLARWRDVRRRIHEDVCAHAYVADGNYFAQSYDSTEVDASLLVIPLVGFLKPDDPRVKGTVAAVERELLEGGFVRRYRARHVDGLPPGEGAFLPCTLWLADNYVLQGRATEAREVFERVLATANDLGLLAEEYDAGSRRMLGNFPQAFSHQSLINTAHNLAQVRGPAVHRMES